MKNVEALQKTACGKRLITCAMVLAMAVGVSVPAPVAADHVKLPAVPSYIQAPPRAKAFLKAHAVGSQNYICLPSGPGFAWTLFGPQATLYKDNGSAATWASCGEKDRATRVWASGRRAEAFARCDCCFRG